MSVTIPFDLQTLAQYGIAGVALYMLYSICNNHLASIEKKLDQLIEILSKKS
jgi:hypothetical protein